MKEGESGDRGQIGPSTARKARSHSLGFAHLRGACAHGGRDAGGEVRGAGARTREALPSRQR